MTENDSIPKKLTKENINEIFEGKARITRTKKEKKDQMQRQNKGTIS